MAKAKASWACGVESFNTPKIRTERRGKSKRTYPPKKCSYCKGLFVPFQKHQKFCCEDHQKLYWKYGTLPFEKLARKLEARLRDMIGAELAPLRARVLALENAAGAAGHLPGVGCRVEVLDVDAHGKRGGGAAA